MGDTIKLPIHKVEPYEGEELDSRFPSAEEIADGKTNAKLVPDIRVEYGESDIQQAIKRDYLDMDHLTRLKVKWEMLGEEYNIPKEQYEKNLKLINSQLSKSIQAEAAERQEFIDRISGKIRAKRKGAVEEVISGFNRDNFYSSAYEDLEAKLSKLTPEQRAEYNRILSEKLKE